ncbi:MAG TPA: hypothetical protein VF173_08885 [Thermoanaerobaculia bacterium]|nr:hypothetical protein [Thermoanaerobaculia bacterium]
MNETRTPPPVTRRTISIETKPTQEGRKTRTFSVDLLAWVLANPMWSLGSTSKERTHRPVLLAFAGSTSAARAFQANLQAGHTASEPNKGCGLRFEVPRSASFRYESTSKEDGTLTLVYLPSVFSLRPPTTEVDSLSFVCMPPSAWVDAQAATLARAMGSDAREAAIAAYFVAFLDAHTALPIANDLRFHLALFRAARKEPWCRIPDGSESDPGDLFAQGLPGIGFEPPVMCNADPAAFAEFLALQTARHLPRELQPQEVFPHGKTPVHRSRRVLPRSAAPAAQLSLFGAL